MTDEQVYQVPPEFDVMSILRDVQMRVAYPQVTCLTTIPKLPPPPPPITPPSPDDFKLVINSIKQQLFERNW